jgi:hypothetical protein
MQSPDPFSLHSRWKAKPESTDYRVVIGSRVDATVERAQARGSGIQGIIVASKVPNKMVFIRMGRFRGRTSEAK